MVSADSRRDACQSNNRVVVIGAGFSGLAAAHHLAERGVSVTVVEAESEPGGLAASYPVGATLLERFYHHWYTGETHVMELIEKLGLADRIQSMSAPAGVYYANTIYRFASPLDLLRFDPLPPIDRLRLGWLVLRARQYKDWRQLDGISAADWLLRLAGRRVFEVMWEPLLLGKFGAYANEVSAAWIWSKLVLRGGNRDKKGKEQLAYLPGGFAIVVKRAVEAIEARGGEVLCGNRATSLQVDGRRVTAVHSNGRLIPCDAVIATPATSVIAELMEPHVNSAYAARLRSIHYLGVVCLILVLDRSLSKVHWLSINDPKFPFVSMIEHTNFVPPADFGGRHIVYLGKYLSCDDELYTMSNDALLTFALPHIQRMFPSFRREWIKDHHVWRAPYGQPIVTCGYARRVPDHATPLENLFIASMAQIYPEDRGTNYAIRDGKRVAELVIERRNSHATVS